MSDPVTLSIGIPTYNQAGFIGQTLRSLLEQTRPAFEIVVSENHCTDDTPAILREFGDAIRVVRPPTHLPMGENWSFLLSELRGSWFSLLSSDDLALPHFVETLSELAAQSDSAVLVRGGYRVIDAEGRPVKDKVFRRNPARVTYPHTLRAQLRGPSTSFAAFAARTASVRAVGGFPSHQMTADWGLWLRLAPQGEFLGTSEIFSEYRQGHHSREVERRRLPLWIRDETEIYLAMLPGIVAQHGGVSRRDLLAASRARCRSRIAMASRLFAPDERTAIVAELSRWAQAVALDEELDALERGEAVARSDRGSVRSVVRTVGRGVRQALGWRTRRSPLTTSPP